MRTRYIIYVIAVLVLIGAAVFWGYRSLSTRDDQSSQSTNGQSSSSSNNGTSNSGTSPGSDTDQQQPVAYPVKVYFSKHPESDNDPSRTFPVQRTSPTLGVATYAITELLKGPTATETNQGYFSTAQLRESTSNCGGADFTISIKDGTGTLKFCRPFDHRGSVADGQASSMIVATLKQFPTIKRVIILNSRGGCEFDLSGEDRCFTNPL